MPVTRKTEIEETRSMTDKQVATTPATIQEISQHFLKSASWVKVSKKTLREVFWWDSEAMFDEEGSLTPLGFERLQEMFDLTSNTRIIEKNGKTRSVRRAPAMSPEAYRQKIWTKFNRFPSDADLSVFDDLASVHATDQGEDGDFVEVEFVELEENGFDPAAEIDQGTQEATKAGQLAYLSNIDVLMNRVEQAADTIASRMEQVFTSRVLERQNAMIETLARGIAPETEAPQVKTRKKKSSV